MFFAHRYHSNIHRDSPRMPVNSIQAMFETSNADVLLIYDACYVFQIRSTAPTVSPPGVTELVAACGFDRSAPGPGVHSFTCAFTQMLRFGSDLKLPFSVADLVSGVTAVLRNSRSWRSKRNPLHTTLVPVQSRRQIMLCPTRLRDSRQEKFKDSAAGPLLPLFVKVGLSPIFSLFLHVTRL